jgi:hypothetical protein
MQMFTVLDASPRSYSIKVSYNYQDQDYIEYTEEEEIGINVKQVVRMETSDFSLPPEIFVGEQLSLYFNIINSGRVSLNNLRVNVEADMDVSQANMFMGKLDQGASVYYEGLVTPNVSGEQSCKITVSGEDDTGESVKIVKEFTTFVNEMVYEETPTDFVDQSETPEPGLLQKILDFIKNPVFIIIAGAVVLAGIIVIVILRRRRNQKRWAEND